MKAIENWLERFKDCWCKHDIDGVLDLFSANVEYYETPLQKIRDIDCLRREWGSILDQKDIDLSYEIFSRDENKYAVVWHLSYLDVNNEKKSSSGTYLIELDSEGSCTYFHQVCES